MATITAANSVVLLTVAGLFDGPQRLKGYATDTAWDIDDADMAETMMGVDGVLSAGFTPFMVSQTWHFQADSPSIALFELWIQTSKQLQETLRADMTVDLPSLGVSYAHTKGFLRRVSQMPGAAKVLRPRTYTLAWEDISPSPLGG